MTVAKVIVPLAVEGSFDYLIGDKPVEVGQLVRVQFGKVKTTGLVVALTDASDITKLKNIEAVEPIVFSEEMIKFIAWVSDYNLIPIGMVFKLAYPLGLFSSNTREVNYFSLVNDYEAIKLSAKQKQVVEYLRENGGDYTAEELQKKLTVGAAVLKNLVLKQVLKIEKKNDFCNDYSIDLEKVILKTLSQEQAAVYEKIQGFFAGKNKTVLLEGATGSGKTEIYFHLMKNYLLPQEENQILFLVPEIAITSQLMTRFEEQFHCRVALWHSAVSNASKKHIWQGVYSGKIRIIIGARSALFLPFKNLSLIVVDEEHDGSYKQTDNGCYNARDMAVVRSKIGDIPMLMGTATPSIETLLNVENKKYNYVFLKNRFGVAIPPKVELVDLKKEKLKSGKYLSQTLKRSMQEELEKSHQVLLFLNNRGYAPIAICGECGHHYSCPYCSANLTVHRSKNRLICHQCDYFAPITNICEKCGAENSLVFFGPGVEKVEEEVKEYFPSAKSAIITSDTVKNTTQMAEIVKAIANRELDIIIGTQIITKGYDFKNITLVGVIDADASLFGGSFRALERTYQLLTQVVGRAGRGELEGRAVIQSYSPDNLIIQALKNNDKDSVIAFEKQNRELISLPPYGKMCVILVGGSNEIETFDKIKEITRKFPVSENVELLGPTPATIYKLNGEYRFKLIVKTPNSINLQKLVKAVLSSVKTSNFRVKVDVNPYSIP